MWQEDSLRSCVTHDKTNNNNRFFNCNWMIRKRGSLFPTGQVIKQSVM